VTPLDFLELLMMRLPIGSKNFPDINIGKVRGHAQAFISLAAKGMLNGFYRTYSSHTDVSPLLRT